jgi:hypothetical protein
MSRKSKSKDQTKALNIPFTLTQGDLLQEALAVTLAKYQTQALLVVSFCILLSEWFFFLGSDRLIGRKWRLLIGKISWLLIG